MIFSTAVAPDDPSSRAQHLLQTCQQALPAALLACGVWSGIFAAYGDFHLSALILVLFLSLFGCWLVSRTWSISVGLLLAELICLIFIVYFSLVHDVPSASVPRVSHVYFLVISFAAYVEYRRSSLKAQLAIVALGLVGFTTFSSLPLSFAFASPIPDEVRAVTAWLNSLTALTILGGTVVLLQREFSQQGRLLKDLRSAIANEELELYYQPQVNRAGVCIGAEALIRWRHRKHGWIPPTEFIPIAQDAGLMPLVGEWVLRQATHTLSIWALDPATKRLTLSVNISADHFLQAGFVPMVAQMIQTADASPDRLKLELTEGMFVSNVDELAEQIESLKTIGIFVSLDDFGTGYSSLGLLQMLSLYQLKIDRSFVRSVADSSRAATLARNIVKMGRDLKFEILAEGIETVEQLQFMKKCGCKAFQGYYFSKPLPLDDFDAYLRAPSTL